MLYETFNSIWIYPVLAILFLFLLPILGRLNFISREFYHSIILINEFFSLKQYLFWVLLFPFSFWLISIILYFFNFDPLIKNLWITTLIFWVALYIYIVFLLRRGLLLSQGNFFLIALLSIVTTFIFNHSFYNQGLEFLLPQNNVWFWTLFFIFIVSSFWYRQCAIADKSSEKIQNYIHKKVNEFRKKYENLLIDLSDVQRKLLLSILIVENYNRPRFIRIFERIFSYTSLTKTTGLAQISKKGLSDYESVKLLKRKIQQEYKGEINLISIRNFLRSYNGGNYDGMVLAVLQNLDNRFIER